MNTIPLSCLPLYARIVVERAQADHVLREQGTLDFLLTQYAAQYGERVDDTIRQQVFARFDGRAAQ